MKIVHKEKQKRTELIRNLKPTDVCYINDQLYMIVRFLSPHTVEVLQLCTGICDYCEDNRQVEPADTALVVYE